MILPSLTLTRCGYTDMGAFGRFSLPSGETLYTVERPWHENKPRISCIPCGEYVCKPRRYNRGGYDAVEVTKVPGRKYIMFHRGNTINDSSGCILVNSGFGCFSGMWGGHGSRDAFDVFMEAYGQEDFQLSIVNYEGGVKQKAA